MSWNPVLNLIKQIKRDYEDTVKDVSNDLEHMIKVLNKNEYIDFINPLEINQNGDLVLIRYGLQEMQESLWEDTNSIYRECRSVVINMKDEELVLTPFRKFFNLNEVDENKENVIRNKIKNADVFEITDKLDGSMQSYRWYKNDIIMSGSRSLSIEESWRLADGYLMLTENYKQLLKNYEYYTFIFEYISIPDAHVVSYTKAEEGLYLIGVRDVSNGQMLTYEQVIELANAYYVKVVKRENYTFDQLLELMKSMKSNEKEGWILNIDGHLVKLKCDDYVNIHRILDKLASANVVIESIAEGNFDDLLSKVPDTYKQRVIDIAEKVYNYVKQTKYQIKYYYELAPKENRKDFMIWVDQNVPKTIIAYVRNEYLGKEYNLLKKQKDGYKRMSELVVEEMNEWLN